ncbi:DNA polymerase I, thermostable [bacterium HR35]|nr:DNA polymerase I, thermostable [bacterium HR35]
MKVVLIDANALLHRVYHALPRLTDFQGRPTNALYGLANILLKFLKEYKPDYIFALYDRPEPTLRHQVFKDYKAQRPKAPDDLRIQINLSKKIFLAFDIPIIEKPGYEADDLIATLKKIFQTKAQEILILTGDLDTLQLVDEKTKILTMKKGISELQIYDSLAVKNKFGILPQQIPDFKALVGDKSDNIPGVPGIGPKTAALLLNKYQTLENLFEATEKEKIDPLLKNKIFNLKDKLLFFKNLVILKDDIELNFNPEDLKYSGYKEEKLIEVFKEFDFRSLIQRLTKTTLFSFKPQDQPIDFAFEKGEIENLKSPFFFELAKEKINVFDGEKLKIFTLNDLEKILLLPHQKICYDFKEIIKVLLKNDFYFDKKINLETIFDFKLVFWLLNSDKGDFSLEEILDFYLKNNSNYYQKILTVYQILVNELKEKELLNLYRDLEIKISPILARMELRGIKVDFEKLTTFKKFLTIKIDSLKEEIYKLAQRRFNLNSPQELSYVLFTVLKLPTKYIAKTKTGIFSTQESELLKLINVHPIIEKILEYRELGKLLKTYTEGFLKFVDPKEKRVYTIFNQTKAATGRIISEKPNLQNLPLRGELAKNFREIFVSQDNFVFVGADYSQIELRILAYLSQDEGLILAFKNDWDIHSEVAKYLFGEINEETRRKAKIVNFGIVYGISAKGLAERLRINLTEARKIIERFFSFYPKVKEYQEKTLEFARKNGYVETLLGRKRFLPEINTLSYREKTEVERIAINMPIQGLGADILKKSMIEIEKMILEKEWQNKAFFVLTIHDEIIFEVAEEIKEEFKVIIKEIMENVLTLGVPLKVNIREGKNLADLIK